MIFRKLIAVVVLGVASAAVSAAESDRIFLVGSELDLEHSELLYSFDGFSSEDWTVFRHGSEGKWKFRDNSLVGGGFAEEHHGQIFYKTPVKGDVVLEFDARTVAPSYHDLVWLWGVRFGEKDWNAGYLGCLGGWWSDMTGIESLNASYTPSCINRDMKLEPGRWYHIVSGSVKGVHFIVVDGRLITRFATATDCEQDGYFGFGFYHSYCEYAHLKVWRPKTVGSRCHYPPAQTEDRIDGGTVDMKVNGAVCKIALTGARALSYAVNDREFLWRPPVWNVTTNRVWSHGGLAICWPWFSPWVNGENKGFGGFAYASSFSVRRHEESADRSVLVLGLDDAARFSETWSDKRVDLEVIYTLTLKSLTVEIKTRNLSESELKVNAGFHPYFDVGDRMQACVNGLEGARWEMSGERFTEDDGVLSPDAKWLPCALPLTHYIDDVFAVTNSRLRIRSLLPGRNFAIESEGTSHVTVHAFRVQKDNRIWHAPVCIEPGCYWDRNAHVLAPGAEDSIVMRILPANAESLSKEVTMKKVNISTFAVHVYELMEKNDLSMSEVIEWLKSQGVIGFDGEYTDPRLDELAAAGLKPAMIYGFMSFRNPERDEIEQERFLSRAQALGAKYMMIVPDHFADIVDDPRDLAYEREFIKTINGLRRLTAKCRAAGICPMIEDFGLRKNPGSRFENLKRYFDEIPDLDFVLDTGNVMYSDRGTDILEEFDLFYSKIRHVHVKDHPVGLPRGFALPGEGAVPNAKMLKKLFAEGYNGWVTLEMFDAPDMRKAIEVGCQFVNLCRGMK